MSERKIGEGRAEDPSLRPPARSGPDLIYRTPTARDARKINELVADCPPLDPNSLYCNLLQCSHFAATCLLAERGGEIKAWISAYRPPEEPGTLFVWQVAVHGSARGLGLGSDLLDCLLQLPAAAGTKQLKTTVTHSNHASRAMFTRFARKHGAEMNVQPWFDSVIHFGGLHESEALYSIGPLRTAPRRTVELSN